MHNNKTSIIDFQDGAGASKAWLQRKFAQHPHGLLSFLDEIEIEENEQIEDVLDDRLLKYRSGLARRAFPTSCKVDTTGVGADFLYEVKKDGRDITVKFYIKDEKDQRWRMLDYGDYRKLLLIYWTPEAQVSSDVDLEEAGIY